MQNITGPSMVGKWSVKCVHMYYVALSVIIVYFCTVSFFVMLLFTDVIIIIIIISILKGTA